MATRCRARSTTSDRVDHQVKAVFVGQFIPKGGIDTAALKPLCRLTSQRIGIAEADIVSAFVLEDQPREGTNRAAAQHQCAAL